MDLRPLNLNSNPFCSVCSKWGLCHPYSIEDFNASNLGEIGKKPYLLFDFLFFVITESFSSNTANRICVECWGHLNQMKDAIRKAKCPHCDGTGMTEAVLWRNVSYTPPSTCDLCDGSGIVCPVCHNICASKCKECSGSGRVCSNCIGIGMYFKFIGMHCYWNPCHYCDGTGKYTK